MNTFICLNAIMRFFGELANKVQPSSTTRQTLLGAEQEITNYVSVWNTELIDEQLFQQKIRWKLKLPAVTRPKRVWEPLARSCKKSMYIVLGNRSVTEQTQIFASHILESFRRKMSANVK